MYIINTPNGIKKSDILNGFSKKLETNPEFSQLKFGFSMGFDGIWELIIQPKAKAKTSAIVFKELDGKIRYFVYTKGFDDGELDKGTGFIKQSQIGELVKKFFKSY